MLTSIEKDAFYKFEGKLDITIIWFAGLPALKIIGDHLGNPASLTIIWEIYVRVITGDKRTLIVPSCGIAMRSFI